MRLIISFFTILISLSSFAQSYVAGGVLAYHGGAYERCIEDLNQALAKPSSLSPEIRAKAYFYRGMARVELRSQRSQARILGSDPVGASLNDLYRARSLDPQWRSRSDKVVNGLLSQIRGGIEQEYNTALTLGPDESRPIFSRTIDRLLFCLNVKNDYDTRVLLAKIYEAYGHLYFNMIEVESQVQNQRQYLSHYSRAISHYEEALKLRNGGSKEVFMSLEVLAQRIGDDTRKDRYGQLASQIGG